MLSRLHLPLFDCYYLISDQYVYGEVKGHFIESAFFLLHTWCDRRGGGERGGDARAREAAPDAATRVRSAPAGRARPGRSSSRVLGTSPSLGGTHAHLSGPGERGEGRPAAIHGFSQKAFTRVGICVLYTPTPGELYLNEFATASSANYYC